MNEKAAVRMPDAGISWLGAGRTVSILLAAGVLLVLSTLIWQAISVGGTPDPTRPHTSPTVALLDIGVLVFREGLECVLVLAAITASMNGSRQAYQRPVAAGAAAGFVITLLTWFVAATIVRDLADNLSALGVQAATGLLAVLVLLIVMNWFFHKVYWGGWISFHNRRKKELLTGADSRYSPSRVWLGFALLGFTSLYREGFEVVLFLQSYYLKMGGRVVLGGAALGLLLSGIVAVLTFVAHRRLPYRKMLVLTGLMLGVVFLVMVGEEVQEMQLAHWISTTKLPRLEAILPDWGGLWFAVFPTVETLTAQAIAGFLVIGSYFAARASAGKPAGENNPTV